ncbi:MAG: T9SS type A sorting domain-containing protein, partial [Bacteroidia bacterium]
MKLFTPFISALVVSAGLNAQVATNYLFSQDTVTYTPITGGTVITSGTFDDNTYTGNNIGFTFNYNGILYTQFGLSINGYITLGGVAPINNYGPISAMQNGNLISVLGADLQLGYRFTGNITANSNVIICASVPTGLYVGAPITGNSILSGTTVTAISGTTVTISQNAVATLPNITLTSIGEIRTETVGTAPYRQCIIQWTSVGRYFGMGDGDCFNFQIVLHETTNTVETIYDIVSVMTTTGNFQVGLRGILNTDFNSRSTNINWQQTIASPSSGGVCTMSSSIFPISGLKFIWQDQAVGISETESQFQVQLYPNPCQRFVTIQFPDAATETGIEVFDVNGRKMLEQQWSSSSLQVVDLQNIAPGVYIMRITTGKLVATQRLVIAE